jgi:hypothetical protein
LVARDHNDQSNEQWAGRCALPRRSVKNHNPSPTRVGSVSSRALFPLLSFFILLFAFSGGAAGQGLNWEGQTGAFITPFADTSKSPNDNLGHPQVAFHCLNTGRVIGNHLQALITVGLLGRNLATRALSMRRSNSPLAWR